MGDGLELVTRVETGSASSKVEGVDGLGKTEMRLAELYLLCEMADVLFLELLYFLTLTGSDGMHRKCTEMALPLAEGQMNIDIVGCLFRGIYILDQQ